MRAPYEHAAESARRWGGQPEDYLAIHEWFDKTAAIVAGWQHQALRHHTEGIFLCEEIFGATVRTSPGRAIPVRWVGEQHVQDDLGRIPPAADWLLAIAPQPWMTRSDSASSRRARRGP
jgi:hypothetical protein